MPPQPPPSVCPYSLAKRLSSEVLFDAHKYGDSSLLCTQMSESGRAEVTDPRSRKTGEGAARTGAQTHVPGLPA